MHERHLFATLPLPLWCAASCADVANRRQLWWCYALLCFTLLYNLITVGALAAMPWSNPFALEPPHSPLIATLKTVAVMAAAVNVGVLLWLLAVLLHQSSRRDDVGNAGVTA